MTTKIKTSTVTATVRQLQLQVDWKIEPVSRTPYEISRLLAQQSDILSKVAAKLSALGHDDEVRELRKSAELMAGSADVIDNYSQKYGDKVTTPRLPSFPIWSMADSLASEMAKEIQREIDASVLHELTKDAIPPKTSVAEQLKQDMLIEGLTANQTEYIRRLCDDEMKIVIAEPDKLWTPNDK